MTTPEALNALADRVEREKPSRRLDAEIDGAIKFDGPEWRIVTMADTGDYRAFKGDSFMIMRSPPYTTSLDAAVTLVPEGCGVVAAWSPKGSMFQVCSMPLGTVEGQRWFPQCKAATPAAALTAAALRARAADMQARAVPSPEQKGSPE